MMKKISLKTLNLKEIETLTREQLRDVLGGTFMATSGSESTTSDNCEIKCESSGDSCKTSDCKTGRCATSYGSLVCVTS